MVLLNIEKKEVDMKLLIVFVIIFIFLNPNFAFSEEAIVFKIPTAVLTDSYLRKFNKMEWKKLNGDAIYQVQLKEIKDLKRYVKTKIGSLGLITTMIDYENNAIGMHYISLNASEPQLSIELPYRFTPTLDPREVALVFNFYPLKSGPSRLNISIGMRDGSYKGPVSLKLDGNSLIFIPLSLFALKDLSQLRTIKITIPRDGDRDGVGSCYFGDIKFVKNKFEG